MVDFFFKARANFSRWEFETFIAEVASSPRVRVWRREKNSGSRRGVCVEHGECEFVFVPEDVE
jgi:hypothetical protein